MACLPPSPCTSHPQGQQHVHHQPSPSPGPRRRAWAEVRRLGDDRRPDVRSVDCGVAARQRQRSSPGCRPWSLPPAPSAVRAVTPTGGCSPPCRHRGWDRSPTAPSWRASWPPRPCCRQPSATPRSASVWAAGSTRSWRVSGPVPAVRWMPRLDRGVDVTLAHKRSGADPATETVITGPVVDRDGRAVAGAFGPLAGLVGRFHRRGHRLGRRGLADLRRTGVWRLRALSASGNGDAVIAPSGAGVHAVDVKIA